MASQETSGKSDSDSAADKKREAYRKIPGDLPWTNSIGVFRTAVAKIIDAERPPQFNADFLESVFDLTGGSARAVIPILKRVGFLDAGGRPTDRYSRFKAGSNRSSAALDALKEGFGEVFKRQTYAYRLPEDKVKDIIIEITGLPKNDRIINYILGTFKTFQDYIKDSELNGAAEIKESTELERRHSAEQIDEKLNQETPRLGISYNINIILPETTNIDVFNSIFKSLKENLLR